MKAVKYFLKDFARATAQSLGYRISQFREPYSHIRTMTGAVPGLVIFDVGANVGQTIEVLRKTFASPVIHAFEPVPRLFQILEQSLSGRDGIYLNRCALGSKVGVQEFKEAGSSVMSSLLEPDDKGWDGKGWKDVSRRYPVEVRTIDTYCTDRGIQFIDVLKTDAQGYDLEVLKGAENIIAKNCVHFIYVEINLSGMYQGQATFDEMYRFLSDRGFVLDSVYEAHDRWMDALFVNPSFDSRARN